MKLTDRDRRLIPILVIGLIGLLAAQFWPQQDVVAPVQNTSRELELARKQLDRYRAVAATLPKRSQDKKKADALLAATEKRLIQAETSAQAQAQLLQIFRRVVRAQNYSMDFRSSDIGRVRPEGDYAAIMLSINFECQIETLVNLLADLSAQPELLSWDDIHVIASDPRQKRISVSLTLLGFGPKKLLPKGNPQA
jgi:uncharacterized membrane-anchored protein YhcB (DUF1043 family)